jgi:hypothetical protein
VKKEGGEFSRIFRQRLLALKPNALPSGGKKMKRLMLFCLIGAFVLASTVVFAQEKAPLGNGNFAVKLDYIAFTDDHFDEASNEDDGLYLGLEGYGEITPNWYLGGEVGTAVNIEIFGGEEITFVPIELNLKYAKEAARNFVVDFGAGLSYCYTELTYVDFSFLRETTREERDDWLFGGQVFVDLTYKIRWFSIGVNGKYQITEDFKDEGVDLSNYRLGVQLGFVF